MNTSTLFLKNGRRWLLWLIVVMALTWSEWTMATGSAPGTTPAAESIDSLQLAGPQAGFGG